MMSYKQHKLNLKPQAWSFNLYERNSLIADRNSHMLLQIYYWPPHTEGSHKIPFHSLVSSFEWNKYLKEIKY